MALSKFEMMEIESRVYDTLSSVYDPEIPVDIIELGLIYDVNVNPDGMVHIKMTLTTPNCPEAAYMPVEIENKVFAIPGVMGVKVEIVWDPPWDPERMSEAARLSMGFW